MAENETKPERKQIEMSVWFVILLVVVIVFMCVFMKMNSDNKALVTEKEQLELRVTNLENESDRLRNGILDLSSRTYSMSPDELKSRLQTLVNADVIIATPDVVAEPVSGEVVSGEVVE